MYNLNERGIGFKSLQEHLDKGIISGEEAYRRAENKKAFATGLAAGL